MFHVKQKGGGASLPLHTYYDVFVLAFVDVFAVVVRLYHRVERFLGGI